jgi:hypothetical protein
VKAARRRCWEMTATYCHNKYCHNKHLPLTHLPHLGSRARFITGAQKVESSSPSFINARASRPICAPVALQSDRLKDIPVVIGYANLVVPLPVFVFLTITPLDASSHHWYGLVPSPTTAGALLPREATFSASVIRDIMSLDRFSSGSPGLQNGIA